MLKWSYRRVLSSDELLVKVIHHHWRVIAVPIFLTILPVAALLFILVTILDSGFGTFLFWVAAIAGVVVWCWLALPAFVRWYMSSYAVTTRRVLFRTGVFRTRQSQVELVRVAQPEVHRSPWDNLFRSGTIDLGGGHRMELVPRVGKMDQLLNQLAANQQKNISELTQILSTLGYKV